MSAPAPLLVLGWGNRSRGDDALGPAFVEALMLRLDARLDASTAALVQGLDDYQLQVEHALDLVGRRHVLFVDASLTAATPFEAGPIRAAHDASFSTHALSPQALLKVFEDLHRRPAPACTLLAIRGEQFELGAPLGSAAHAHLARALNWAETWVRRALAEAGAPA
jgi:hydrogenase maturation protease